MGGTGRVGTEPRLGCRQVRRTLQAFLDGEVDPVDGERVAAHLESCSRCQIEAEIQQLVIAALRRLRPDLNLTAYTRLVAVAEQVTRRERG